MDNLIIEGENSDAYESARGVKVLEDMPSEPRNMCGRNSWNNQKEYASSKLQASMIEA